MSIQNQEFLYNIFRKEIKDRKIPLSLGKTCPVKCTFCYEIDHSYRNPFEPPLTPQEHWEFIFNEICSFPTREEESWVLVMNIWSGQILLSIQKQWIGLKSFWIKRIRRSLFFLLVILIQLGSIGWPKSILAGSILNCQ